MVTPLTSWFRRVSCALLAVVLAGCPASSEEVRPPGDQFFFPTGAALSSDERSLLVLNANSDLRYDSGTMTVVDLDEVDSMAADWLASGDVPARDCEVDSTTAFTLVCNEAEVLVEDATVRIGNFATELGVQVLTDGSNRVFAAVRGDPSLTWIDFDPGERRSECGGGGSLPRCDEQHRLSRLFGDESIGNIPSEPFGVYVDSEGGFVVTTHLSQGAVSLAQAPKGGAAPRLTDAVGGAFFGDQSGVATAIGAAGRVPGGRVYVTSSTEERVQTFSVARLGDSPPALLPAGFFFLSGVSPSDEARGIRFDRSGYRAYIINRSPPVLQVLDTSLNENNVPRNELRQAVEICANAAGLAVGDAGDGERVYVGCFREGQVWVVEPQSGEVEAIVNVGRGPQSLVVSESRQKLYVTNFLEDTVGVIDVEPGATSENRVVLKLGRSRQSGGN